MPASTLTSQPMSWPAALAMGRGGLPGGVRETGHEIELILCADTACRSSALCSALLIAQWGQGNMGISMMPGAGMYPGGGMAGLGGGGTLRLSPVHADPAGFGGGLGGMF